MTQGYFQGLSEAKVYERGVWLEPGGRYKLKIDKTIVKPTRASGDGFIAEFTVLESTNPKNPPGSKASWFQGLRDKDVAFGAIKEFLYAVMGYNDQKKAKAELDPVIENLINEAITKNSLAGKEMDCQTSSKLTKNKVVFTVHTWSPPTK